MPKLFDRLRIWLPAPVVRPVPPRIVELHMTDEKSPIVLVNENELAMWPNVPESSQLWSLEYARDTSKIISAINSADEPRDIHQYDELMAWLFDICTAWFVMVVHTEVIGGMSSRYLDMLTKELLYRPSPLLNGPENLEDDTRTAYRKLLKKHRPLQNRYPNLLRQMQWVAVLSAGEARNALASYIRGERWSGEAVDHFGGNVAVIEAAISRRWTTWSSKEWSSNAANRCKSGDACRWHGQPQF